VPAFIEQFALCVQREHERLSSLFSSDVANDEERELQSGIRHAWRPLWAAPAGRPRPAYASDGSQAIRHFNNGWSAIVCQSLCVGPHFESPAVDLRFLRSTTPDAVLGRYAGLVMRLLEVRSALEHVERAAGGVMCLDGSLQAALPHLLYPLALKDAHDLPLAVLETYLDLLDACARHDVLLLSLSKTSTSSFLGESMLRLSDVPLLPADVDLDQDEDLLPELPSDTEIVFRWAAGAGSSRPVVLGSYGFGNRRGQLLRAPDELARAFTLSDSPFSARVDLFKRLADAPASVGLYARLRDHEDAVRVDVPAPSVGLQDRIRDVYLRWGDDAQVGELLGHLMGSYGGPSVYHAALYVVDRLVRLHNAAVDTAYLSVIRSQFGAFVQYDRSRRRFL
jgi:hypothetical protein